jgi:hypothetical protein
LYTGSCDNRIIQYLKNEKGNFEKVSEITLKDGVYTLDFSKHGRLAAGLYNGELNLF